MPKIDITRTELVWPDKYGQEGNLVPPRCVSQLAAIILRAGGALEMEFHGVLHYETPSTI
jgi:hypothetical protein